MTTALSTDLAWKFRNDQMKMRNRMVRDLRRVWPSLDFARLDATYPVWSYSVEQVVRLYELDSIERTRGYLETFYDDQGIIGRPAPFVDTPRAPEEQIDALLHSQAVSSIKRSTAMGAPVVATMSRVLSTTSLSMVRVVRDESREFIRQTALTDDRLGGWQRVGTGDTCAFCRMLVGRGAVYSESTVRFASHTNCNCEVQPSYSDLSKSVDEYRKSDRTIKFDDKQINANKDRVVKWLETHDVG